MTGGGDKGEGGGKSGQEVEMGVSKRGGGGEKRGEERKEEEEEEKAAGED